MTHSLSVLMTGGMTMRNTTDKPRDAHSNRKERHYAPNGFVLCEQPNAQFTTDNWRKVTCSRCMHSATYRIDAQ